MERPADILSDAETVLVVDWPSRDVPEALARAGLYVVVHGGPGPDDYAAYEDRDGDVVTRHLGHPPERADVVYVSAPSRSSRAWWRRPGAWGRAPSGSSPV
ncbi:MAG: hypothetical protein M3203_09325 [Actinomycetota bacterium]|nr:hypothetical protein [Actinomycetota bacterium]